MKYQKIGTIKKSVSIVLLITLPLFASFALLAHGQLHPQIEAVSKQLKQQPNNRDLLLRRAVLWSEHGELDKALRDVKQVLQNNPDSAYALLLSGRLKKDQRDYVNAVKFANQFIALFPKQAKGYLLRASILQNMVDKSANTNAISDYSTAIGLLKHPRPELFLQRADLQLLQQENGVELTLQQLAAARERYGYLYVLQKRAFDIAHQAERFAVAITLAVDITAHMQRKEQWLKRQGDVQQAMGDDKSAQQSYRAAQAAIKQLPQRLQRHTDMLSLQQELIVLIKKTDNQ
jgi:tetratricopeptide (TPR) repeat protein